MIFVRIFFELELIITYVLVLTGNIDNFDSAVTPTVIFCFASVCSVIISIDAVKVQYAAINALVSVLFNPINNQL